ncbi:hypothetical protein SAY87_004316 [Trapa incisa]|uniref:UV-B-induced protein At3g17800, chloroplastic-like n=2 Tax=Trapa TaxID=22665 RepID=A0AAN7L6Z1_TRANT|nr:hypothetical protein SAY87_004316 [Trapa incisa]KAK4782383.1 hypothetical protein SAY86_016485 [Trapa natans]
MTSLGSLLGVSRPYFMSKSGYSTLNGSNSVMFEAKLRSSMKHFHSTSQLRPVHLKVVREIRRSAGVRASLSSESAGSSAPIAPLKLESPVGQFLSQILISHPHLLPSAVDQQLEQLQVDIDSDKTKEEEHSATGTDLVLYRRIAEVKANERKKALEEILYTLVVKRFMDADVHLTPSVSSSSDHLARADLWPNHEGKFERLHSPEAYEMIQNHLALILGNRAGDPSTIPQISKLRVGQVYAASVMYGYFLKRVDQRFQLEKAMKILPGGLDGEETDGQRAISKETEASSIDKALQFAESHPEVSSWDGGFGYGIKPSRLRTYVMAFDGDTLQRYATIRSKEAVGIIEKHTEALFGRPEIMITPEGTVDSSRDELITISFTGLKSIIMEAVTFGSFLWDVESYVDSRFHFVFN